MGCIPFLACSTGIHPKRNKMHSRQVFMNDMFAGPSLKGPMRGKYNNSLASFNLTDSSNPGLHIEYLCKSCRKYCIIYYKHSDNPTEFIDIGDIANNAYQTCPYRFCKQFLGVGNITGYYFNSPCAYRFEGIVSSKHVNSLSSKEEFTRFIESDEYIVPRKYRFYKAGLNFQDWESLHVYIRKTKDIEHSRRELDLPQRRNDCCEIL